MRLDGEGNRFRMYLEPPSGGESGAAQRRAGAIMHTCTYHFCIIINLSCIVVPRLARYLVLVLLET